ncbi:MAG TPA: phosphatase PAP2 family protein [Microbacterium sp.]|uniref:phosphatase PAP2 family protein n=1 Tax=Microbacterium sp. TaxID=51671 RepID=UPI002B478F35|nr:phosphatase PAP2 family protein [Microbacterium sp.]HKT56825.1 phosphatase PAP2 family protein [Microbacterium sp.]
MTARLRMRPFAVVAVVLAAAFVATYLFFVRTYVGQIVDERAFNGAADQHALIQRLSAVVLRNVAWIAIGGGVILTLLIGGLNRRPKHIVAALVAGAAALGMAELSKYVFLSRAQTGATDVFNNSFPSGHATVAAAAAFAVFLVSTPRWRPLAAVLGGGFAMLTGVLAVISQWHRPSDVVAAFMLVGVCGSLAGVALIAWRVPTAPEQAGPLRAMWWIAGVSALVSLAAFILIYVSVQDHGSHLQVAYAGGSTAIVAVGSGFAAAGNRLFRRLA